MDFQATPINVIILLLIALGVYALYFLIKRQSDSNVPLIFYAVVMVFTMYTGREWNSGLLLCGLCAALVLRFEFMNRRFMNLIWTIEVLALGGISIGFFKEAFGLTWLF